VVLIILPVFIKVLRLLPELRQMPTRWNLQKAKIIKWQVRDMRKCFTGDFIRMELSKKPVIFPSS
jgi:hypothetical protein